MFVDQIEILVDNSASYHSSIELKETYRDSLYMYRPTGGPGFHVDCKAVAKKSLDKNRILILVEGEIGESYLFRIRRGVEQFLENLSKINIRLDGMDIILSDHKMHPIDTNPICYAIAMQIFLSNIVLSEYVENHYADSKLGDYNLQKDRIEAISYQNLNYYQARTNHIPSKYKRKLYLDQIIRAVPTDTNEAHIAFQIEPMRVMALNDNRIVIRLKRDFVDTSSDFLSRYILEATRVIQEFTKEQISLCGMIIYIFSLQSEKKLWSLDIDIIRFGWLLRKVLRDESHVMIKEN